MAEIDAQSPTGAAGVVREIDAATLSPEEWFVFTTLLALKPGAEQHHTTEFQRVTLGRSKREQLAVLTRGIEKLMERGVIRRALDAKGQPLEAETPYGKLPGFDVLPCRIITRVNESSPRA